MSTDSTKEAMRFNGHMRLPFKIGTAGCVVSLDGFVASPDSNRNDWKKEEDTCAFIVHACNTYYERERARQQDKARIEELAKALSEAVAIIDSQIGRSRSTQAKRFLRRRIDPLRAILTTSTK